MGYFFLVFGLYSLTNAYALQLSHLQPIATIALPLDEKIIFIPSMIVLYSCSLWLLMASFWLASTRMALQRLTSCLLLATIVACSCFYALPLMFSRQLPNDYQAFDSLGVNWQWAFTLLQGIDKPYNQLPSLHVAYAVILLKWLWQNDRLIFNLYLSLLCLGIAVSTLFTWQHHLLDILGGAVLAWAVIWAEHNLVKKRSLARSKLTIKYSVVAVSGFLLIAIVPALYSKKSSWQMMLASYWLVSFGMLAGLYAWKNEKITARIFAKNPHGTLSFFSKFLQLPIILMYQQMWQMATRLKLANTAKLQSLIRVNHSLSTLAIANPTPKDIDFLQSLVKPYQIVIWLDLASEMDSHFSQFLAKIEPNFSEKIHYYSVPLLDLQPFDALTQPQVLAIIQRLQPLSPNTLIICQCAMGWSRSVAMVGCLLAYFTELKPTEIRQILASHYPNHHAHADYLNETILRFLATQNHAKIIKISSKCR